MVARKAVKRQRWQRQGQGRAGPPVAWRPPAARFISLHTLNQQCAWRTRHRALPCHRCAAQGALAILERAVRTGTSALRATASDSAWAFVGGDAIDPTDRARNRRAAVALLAAATGALSSLLLALRPLAAPGGGAAGGGLRLRSRGAVDALLAAHAAATVHSYDSLAASAAVGATHVHGAAPPAAGPELLPARLAAAAALGAWVEAGWEPAVLPAAFGLAHSYRPEAAADRAHLGFGVILTAAAAAEDASATPPPPEGREPSSTALAPEAAYCLMVLLGDVFPREWPPPASPAAQQQGLQPAAFPPPSHMARRSALAR